MAKVKRVSSLFSMLVFVTVPWAIAADLTDDLSRMDMPFEVRVAGEDDPENPRIRCLATGLIRNDGEIPMIQYNRVLCETSRGRLAMYGAADLGSTGEIVSVLVDVDSGSWLRIVDQPEIEPRGVDEDIWAWQGRANEIRDHLVTTETSTRLFDPFDAEVTEEARSVLWEDLQTSDPEIAELVAFLLERLGACRHPWCDFLTVGIDEWVYAGPPISSPEVQVRRLGKTTLEDPDEHEQTDFEHDFGKWGDSFPDPPRLQ